MIPAGVQGAAGALAAEVQANGARIRKMHRLIGECDCDEETKAMPREQVQHMEQEMNRLQALARNETESRGACWAGCGNNPRITFLCP